MRIQLRLLDDDEGGGDRPQVWQRLPQPARQQLLEQLADLLLRSARESRRKEQQANEDQGNEAR
jgi:hypothetical protein